MCAANRSSSSPTSSQNGDLLGEPLLVHRHPVSQHLHMLSQTVALGDHPLWRANRNAAEGLFDDCDPLEEYRDESGPFGLSHPVEFSRRRIDDGHELLDRAFFYTFRVHPDHIRHPKHGGDVHRALKGVAIAQCFERVGVVGEPSLVHGGHLLSLALVAGEHGHVTAGDALAQGFSHLDLPSLEGSGELDTGIEKAMVDGTQFDGDSH